MNKKQKAVFLDRDGVLNKLIWNPKTMAYESPHQPEDLFLLEDIIEPLRSLNQADYKLFIVSNQPSFAKGKTSLENIKSIAKDFQYEMERMGVVITEAFYCYHHPAGIVPEFSFNCICRKPEPFFLHEAQKKYHIDFHASWMIGDRDSDIEFGKKVACKTILIKNFHSADHQGRSSPDYVANNLRDAVKHIFQKIKNQTGGGLL